MIQTPQVIAIDDDVELLKLIAMLLRRVGAQSTTFSDGRAALAHLAEHVPHLILLDLMLPEPNGVEILQTLRADPRLEAVPILILSAKADARSMQQGLELGADGFVTKPYVANTLVERIQTALTQGRAPRPPNVPPPAAAAPVTEPPAVAPAQEEVKPVPAAPEGPPPAPAAPPEPPPSSQTSADAAPGDA